MEILERGVIEEEIVYIFHCNHCNSKLRAPLKELTHQIYRAQDYYEFVCPVCTETACIEKSDLVSFGESTENTIPSIHDWLRGQMDHYGYDMRTLSRRTDFREWTVRAHIYGYQIPSDEELLKYMAVFHTTNVLEIFECAQKDRERTGQKEWNEEN